MTDTTRRWILRTNALFLILFGGSGFLLDLRAYFLGKGPQSVLIANAPHTAIGFVEAHGLAVIIGVLLWRARPSRPWHFTAATVHILLGASNLLFWQIFVAGNVLPLGYISTGLHWLFVVLHLWAAVGAPREVTTSAAARAVA